MSTGVNIIFKYKFIVKSPSWWKLKYERRGLKQPTNTISLLVITIYILHMIN